MSDVMTVSIIIPAYNEEEYIGATLSRLEQELVDKCSFEIIVIDNASTDNTANTCNRYSSVKVRSLPSAVHVAEARNVGASMAIGEVYVFLDADILVTSRWARRLAVYLANIEQNQNVLTGAQCYISENPSWLEKHWFGQFTKREPNYINSANIVLSKDLFVKLSGFDASLVTCEDVDISDRALKLGASVVNDYEFEVHHEGYPSTLLAFAQREVWHGSGDYSSLNRFIHSTTAVTSLIYLCVCLLSIACTATLGIVGLLLLPLVVIIPYLVARYKFKQMTFRESIVNTFIAAIYLIARAVPFVRRG